MSRSASSSAAGAYLASWPVVYPADKIRWDSTDGLEAIDGTYLVRTGYLNAPIGCDPNGVGCVQAGIEILELTTDTSGAPVFLVTQQILLPEPYNLVYPVGVAKVGANFAVATCRTRPSSSSSRPMARWSRVRRWFRATSRAVRHRGRPARRARLPRLPAACATPTGARGRARRPPSPTASASASHKRWRGTPRQTGSSR